MANAKHLSDRALRRGESIFSHYVKASRILDHFEWSAPYEIRDDEAVKIMPVAAMGFLQVQARNPVPSIYIDARGDLTSVSIATKALIELVARGGIEPPTRGFSVQG